MGRDYRRVGGGIVTDNWYAVRVGNGQDEEDDMTGPFTTKRAVLWDLGQASATRESGGLYKVGRWWIGRRSTLIWHDFMQEGH